MASTKKLIEKAREHMDPDEPVVAVIAGQYETKRLGQDSIRKGIFIATDSRLIFYAKKLTGFDFEVFPYSNISSVEMSKGIMGHSISFFASGNKVKMKWISEGKEEVKKLVEHVRNSIGRKTENGSSINPPSSGAADQIEKLHALKEKGILTEEEFQTKKQQLLS